MPAMGMGSWKFSLGKIIHGKKLSCGLRITASTSPVNFCYTLHLDLMKLPWLALCIGILQLSLLDVVNS